MQSPNPMLHVVIWQVPASHSGVALGRLQAFWQPPQFWTSVWMLLSQPSAAMLLQSRYGPVHIPIAQLPEVHWAVA